MVIVAPKPRRFIPIEEILNLTGYSFEEKSQNASVKKVNSSSSLSNQEENTQIVRKSALSIQLAMAQTTSTSTDMAASENKDVISRSDQ